MALGVHVVGAGTAGLIAARSLASSGISTFVYDQKKVLGYPANASGILSINGLALLGVDYNGAITNTLYGANLHAGGKTLAIKAAEPMAHVLDRQKLNELCYDQAVSAGAKAKLGRRIDGTFLDRLSRSGIIVGADGAVSSVASHFSMGQAGNIVLTYKAEYNVASHEKGVVDLYFDNSLYKGLFAWACPNSEDILELGVGVGAGSGMGNAKAAYERFANSEKIVSLIGSAKPISSGASIIPVGLRNRIVDHKRKVLLVGDAAGQVKPTTGGGIIFGGGAALLAADAIKQHLDSGASLGIYRKNFMAKYGNELLLHRLIGFYKHMATGHMGLAFDLMGRLGLDSFLGKYGDMDMPSLMLKRFFLRGFLTSSHE